MPSSNRPILSCRAGGAVVVGSLLIASWACGASPDAGGAADTDAGGSSSGSQPGSGGPDGSTVGTDGGSGGRRDDGGSSSGGGVRGDAAAGGEGGGGGGACTQSVNNGTHDYISSKTQFKLPDGTWRPFADDAWVNTPLPANPKIDARSSTYVQNLMSQGDKVPRDIVPIYQPNYEHPFYFNNATPTTPSTDPVYTTTCTRGACTSEPGGYNGEVHIPCGALPADGSDAHMVVIDQYTGKSYEWFEITDTSGLKSCSGGKITAGTAGATSITGDARSIPTVAVMCSGLAGQIRAQEMAAAVACNGPIHHALFMVDTGCQQKEVYPGDPNNYCNQVGPDYPPIGQMFALQMSDADIDSGPYPAWQKTILKTLAHYGMFVGDQGSNHAFEFQTESVWTYESFNQTNPWQSFLGAQGASDGLSFSNLSTQFWSDHLVAIDPCVIEKTCK